MPRCVSSLLTTPILGSAVGEWLLWLAAFPACQLVLVSPGSEWLPWLAVYCKPADDAFPRLSSLWVASVPRCISSTLTMPVLGSSVCERLPCLGVSSLLTTPVLGSPVCEWLPCLAVFEAC